MKKYIAVLMSIMLLVLMLAATSFSELLETANEAKADTTVILVDREDDIPDLPSPVCDTGEAPINDNDNCTLRQAIADAKNSTQSIIIKFSDDLDGVGGPNILTLSNSLGGSDNLPILTQTNHAITVDGENHVIITHDGTGQYEYLFRIGNDTNRSSNNVIKNLIVNDFANGIVIQGPNNTIQNVTMNGGTDISGCSDNGQRGISIIFEHIPQPQGNTILNNEISCFRKGVMAQFVGQTTITGNVIRNNNSENLNLDDGFVGAPSFEDTHPCFTAGIEVQGSLNATFGVNTISNNQIHLNGSEESGSCTGTKFASAGIMLDDFTFPASFDTIPPTDDPNIGKEIHVFDAIISGNHLSENIGDGIVLNNAHRSIVRSNNIIEKNGTDTSTEGNSDQGNGLAIRCSVAEIVLGGDSSGAQDNFVYRNNISRNADNGIFVENHCGSDGPNDNINNTFLENSIYENGRNTGTSDLADDGIGIDLQADGDVTSFAYSTGNANISANDANDPDTGGNDVQNFPVISSVTFNSSTNEWTVVGTVTPADDTLVELFEVGCTDPEDVTTCDADDDDGLGLGFGSGRNFLGRDLSAGGNWTIVVPPSAGFSGGLLTTTATSTTTDTDICMAPSTSAPDVQSTVGSLRVCNTSEFSENFLAQIVTPPFPGDPVDFNKFVIPSSVPQGGTVTVILAMTNTSQAVISDGEFTINDNLTVPGLTFDVGSCTWATPSDSGACSRLGNDFVLTGFDTGLNPASTLTIQFTATVPNGATLGSHNNTANLLYTDTFSASDTFTVTAPGGGGSCSLPDTLPNAVFTIDSTAHGPLYATSPGVKVFASVDPTAGNAPLSHNWIFDGSLDSQTGANASFNITSGSHTVTHVVVDCDGDIATDSVNINSTIAGVPNLVLSKSILPNTNLHTGDAVTVTIQATNPVTTGIVLTDIVLKDVFTALNQSVSSCRFEKNILPGGGSATCTVAPDGSMNFPLTLTGLQPSDTLYVQYTTTVTGAPGTYTNPVSYMSSNPLITPAPAPASAQFTVVSGTSNGTCTGTSGVDAEFSINGEPTPTTTISKPAGTYTFVNDDTSGDGPITYQWFIDGVLQPETSNSMTRTLAPGTVPVTLMKSDCNGSTDTDMLTITITGGTGVGTGGAFDVTKTVENPKTLYAVDGGSTESVIYRIIIKNNEAVARTYTLEDDIPTTFKDAATVLDTAGGTNATIPGLVKVTNISLLPGETKTVRYSVTFKSANDFPLNLYSLDHNADPLDDSDFYVDGVKEEDIKTSNNNFTDEDDITDAPDGQFVSLGEDGSIIVDVGTKKVIVDGEGDDFGLFTIDNHVQDFDQEDEDVKVSVSQDGLIFEKLSGTETFDLGDVDMPWARYVKIEDDTNTSVTQSGAAGIDIDAVCLFNLGVPVTNQANVTMTNAVGSASNTLYVDVTEAFDDPLTKSDCRETGPTVTQDRQPRTVELPPPPQPLPTPPVSFPPSSPILPTTGTETLPLLATGILGMIGLLSKRRKK